MLQLSDLLKYWLPIVLKMFRFIYDKSMSETVLCVQEILTKLQTSLVSISNKSPM